MELKPLKDWINSLPDDALIQIHAGHHMSMPLIYAHFKAYDSHDPKLTPGFIGYKLLSTFEVPAARWGEKDPSKMIDTRTLKEALKEKVREFIQRDEYFDLHANLIGLLNLENVPMKVYGKEEAEAKGYKEGEQEDLDFENWKLFSMNDDELFIAAGGDWQGPLQFKVKYENGQFVCFDAEDCLDWRKDEVDTEAFLDQLFTKEERGPAPCKACKGTGIIDGGHVGTDNCFECHGSGASLKIKDLK
jgi:hypothetical protein